MNGMETLMDEPAVDAPLAVSFQEESLLAVWGEARPLMERHAAEVGCLPGLKLQPNVEAYSRGVEAGYLRAFTMRGAKAELVGYCSMGVSPHLHWSQTVWAIQDVLFVEPGRRGIRAVEFILWMDEQLFKDVDAITRFSTLACPYGRTLERMGYVPLGTTYIRTKSPMDLHVRTK